MGGCQEVQECLEADTAVLDVFASICPATWGLRLWDAHNATNWIWIRNRRPRIRNWRIWIWIWCYPSSSHWWQWNRIFGLHMWSGPEEHQDCGRPGDRS